MNACGSRCKRRLTLASRADYQTYNYQKNSGTTTKLAGWILSKPPDAGTVRKGDGSYGFPIGTEYDERGLPVGTTFDAEESYYPSICREEPRKEGEKKRGRSVPIFFPGSRSTKPDWPMTFGTGRMISRTGIRRLFYQRLVERKCL